MNVLRKYYRQFRVSPVFRLKTTYTIVLYTSGLSILTTYTLLSFATTQWWVLLGVASVYGLVDYFAPEIEIKRLDRPESSRISIDITEAPSFFAVVVLGPSGVLAVALATFIVMRILLRLKWLDTFDGIANRVILYVAIYTFYMFFPTTPIPFVSTVGFLCFLGIMLLYPLIGATTIALQRAVLFYKPFWHILREESLYPYLISILASTMGGLASIVWFLQPWLILPAVIPIILAQRAIHAVVTQDAVNTRLQEIAQAKEQAEAASQFKSQFISMVSHDLRTPLNAILNYAQFLSKPRYGPLTERQQDIQQRLLANTNQLLVLVNDLLDKAKIEAGQISCEPTVVDLPTLVQECIDNMQSLADTKGLSVQVQFADPLLHSWCDAKLTRQVVLNLLSNAVKFTEHGSIEVRIARETAQYVTLAIADTGMGIPPDQHDHIFEAFQQVLSPSAITQPGSGLGLAICKQLVELQEGTMWFKSEVGVGSTFFVRLPVPSQPDPSLPSHHTIQHTDS
ncbi:MAG: HAMP domain-containing sensor histidine kinase [Chloroflexota bacterium]